MSINSIYDISSLGMDFNRLKLEAIALNVTNSKVANVPGGSSFKPLTVNFANNRELDMTNFNTLLENTIEPEIVELDKPDKLIFEPSHPDADAAGYVSYPNVNLIDEMTDLMLTIRAYEANVKVLSASKSMAMKALEIGAK